MMDSMGNGVDVQSGRDRGGQAVDIREDEGARIAPSVCWLWMSALTQDQRGLEVIPSQVQGPRL